MPSPSPEHPGLFIRDPYRFSDAMLVIPPPLVECLECFDGLQTELDLRAALVSITGELEVGQLGQHLVETLSAAGFLEDAQYAEMEQARKREFALATVREPTHAGPADGTRDGWRPGPGGRWPLRGRSGRRRSVRNCRAARQPAGRVAKLPGGVRPAAPPTQGPDVRDPGHVALRRAGDIRPDAQDVPHAAGRRDRRYGTGGLAGGPRRQRRRDGRLLPQLRAHGGVAGDLSAARAGAGSEDPAGAGGTLRAQPLPGRRSGRRRSGEGVRSEEHT